LQIDTTHSLAFDWLPHCCKSPGTHTPPMQTSTMLHVLLSTHGVPSSTGTNSHWSVLALHIACKHCRLDALGGGWLQLTLNV